METASKNVTNVVRSMKLLKVDGYCATKTMGNEDCIKSTHSIGGYEWEICIYPAMMPHARDGTPWVAVKLVFLSETCPSIVRANLSCRLVDPRSVLRPSEEKSVSCIFNRSWVSRCLQMCSPFVSEDCSLPDDLPARAATVPGKEMTGSSPSLQNHLAELLHSGLVADVTFVVSGKSFAAHKVILAARSPVLMAEFFGHMKETSSQRVEIKDIVAVVFKSLLCFIYTDSVMEFEMQHEEVTMLAQHLLAAADKYGLDRLKEICEGKLSDGISVYTAATTLALAEQHNCPQLKVKCVDFIVSTPAILDAVLATDGYKHLEASCPMVLPELLKSARGRKS
ncbi:Speckle-type POZ protein [Hordeum vulgare]|nr:Speckle-type POZ protein [Hordeum vulgare]